MHESPKPDTCLMGRALESGMGGSGSHACLLSRACGGVLPRRKCCAHRTGGAISGSTSSLQPAATLAPPAPLSCFCPVIPLIPLRQASLVWPSAPSAPSESEEGPRFLALEQDRLLSVHLVSKRPFQLGGGVCTWLTEAWGGGKRDELWDSPPSL